MKVIETKESIIVAWVTKATLYHLDGTTSEMRLTTPRYSMWGEAQELAVNPIHEYINSLTTHFIKIHSYKIECGNIDSNGIEDYFISCEIVEIPLNKVYYKGKWVNPEKVKEMQLKKYLAERTKTKKAKNTAKP